MTNKTLRQTKILATIGPASSNPEMLRKLFDAGVNAFRLNFSHGSHEEHKQRYDMIRAIEKETGVPISILADMQGPKLRLGQFENEKIDVGPGHEIRLDLDQTPGNSERVNLPHPEIIEALQVGEHLLVDDGKVRMEIIEKGDDYVRARVINGTKLSDRKGVNVPGSLLKMSILTEKDRKDLEYALSLGVDWIALSFVQRPEDVREAKELIKGRAPVISKLEKPSAIDHLQAIIDESDAIMLARGDLGVEIPGEKVPAVQKKVVRAVRAAGKPLVIATQMLESMITSPMPTRAEASDVATAVYDGADTVMLSAETAAGDFPVEAVSFMSRVAQTIEADMLYTRIMDADHPEPGASSSDAITAAAHQVASTVGAKVIVNYTRTGLTTLKTVRERPQVPILCLTADEKIARRLMLSYGVRAIPLPGVFDLTDVEGKAIEVAKEYGFVEKGDRLVVTAGVPLGEPGSTNTLRILKAE